MVAWRPEIWGTSALVAKEEEPMQEESTEERTEEQQDQPQDMDVGAGPAEETEEQSGADSAAQEETREDEQQSEDTDASGDDSDSDSDDDEMTDIEKEKEEARQEVEALADDPPQDLSDWPSGKAKYETLGGADSESGYDDSATANLGPSDVRHYEDGSVEVGGEKVDNPEDYKSDPIPGGPTDPNTPATSGEQDLSEKSSSVDTDDQQSSDDDEDSDSDSDSDSENG
jgi:hypothetical protein